MIRYCAIFCAALLAAAGLTAGTAYPQEGTAPKETLSFESYLGKIREKLPELKKNRIAVERARNARLAADAPSDTMLEGSGAWNKTWRYSSNPFSRRGYESTYSANLGVSKKIPPTGTTLRAGASYTQFRSDIDYGSFVLPDAYHYPSYYAGFTQSLLNNAFGVIDRFAARDAEMKIAIEKLRADNADKSDLNRYRKLYFDWVEQAEKLTLLQKSIANAEALRDQVARKFRLGLAENDDVQNAAASALQYRAAYEEAAAAYRALLGEIGLLVDTSKYAPSPGEFDARFSASETANFSEVPFEKTRSAEIYRLMKNNHNYAREVAENKLLPQLELHGMVTRKAQDSDFAAAAGGMNNTDYYLGFSVTYPLGNSQAESEARIADLAIEEVNREFDISRNDYGKNLTSLLGTAGGIKKMIGISGERIKALESKYRTEEKKYLQARLDLNFLIASANALTAERINLLGLKKQLIYHHIDYTDLTE